MVYIIKQHSAAVLFFLQNKDFNFLSRANIDNDNASQVFLAVVLLTNDTIFTLLYYCF